MFPARPLPAAARQAVTLATRLLWETAPDPALLTMADAGAFTSTEDVRQLALRMLIDARATAGVESTKTPSKSKSTPRQRMPVMIYDRQKAANCEMRRADSVSLLRVRGIRAVRRPGRSGIAGKGGTAQVDLV